MARWIIVFVVGFVFLCALYYAVRLRTTREDEIKEHRHAAAERHRRQAGDDH
jgi:hypothetical protein